MFTFLGTFKVIITENLEGITWGVTNLLHLQTKS